MNFHQKFKTSSFLVAAFSLWALAGQPTPVVAGGSLGGLIGAATGTVGQVAGSATSTIAGTATDDSDTAGTTSKSAKPGYSGYGHPKVAVTAKLKVSLLKAKAGVYVLGKHNQLVRINANV